MVDPREVILRRSERMPNGCLEWQGPRDKDGYGMVKLGRRSLRAHRVAYEAFRGPIPEGAILDHIACDNPPCVDWWHTEPSTHRENTLRSRIAPAALNAVKTHCVRGHPFAGEHMRISVRTNGNTRRTCRTCERLVRQQHRAARRAAA